MPLREIITAVTERLEGVQGVANVFNYQRRVNNLGDFERMFKDPNAAAINAWFVTRDGSEGKDEESQAYSRTHSIVMLGYMSVNDAANSEGTFQDVIESVCAAFDPLAARQLGGIVNWSTPTSVTGPTTLMFGGILCHAVKITVRTKEYPLT